MFPERFLWVGEQNISSKTVMSRYKRYKKTQKSALGAQEMLVIGTPFTGIPFSLPDAQRIPDAEHISSCVRPYRKYHLYHSSS